VRSIENSGLPVIEFPLGGSSEMESLMKTIASFSINVWAGVPTTLLQLVQQASSFDLPPPTKILFGGESMYPDQISLILRAFPGVQIQSIGYASVDGGLLGFCDESCGPQEHRVFTDQTLLEILDEDTLEPIREPGRSGKLYLTNLTRMLMPILRYPVGDKAEWIDSSPFIRYRKFKILGRTEEGARVGPSTVYYEDIHKLFAQHQDKYSISGFQLLLKHYEHRDQLIVRVASDQGSEIVQHLLPLLLEDRPFLEELAKEQKIHPTQIEVLSFKDLATNPRTGKLKRVIDQRG